MEVINGVLFHAVGASSAAVCYTPQKKILQWSWQTYWLAQASVCWLLLPVVMALLTIPHLGEVLREAPARAMLYSFLLGMAYGIGGTAFGMAIKYVGFSLTYAISVGISCVLGTVLPPLINGSWRDIVHGNGAAEIIAGIGMGAAGIALCGLAGRNKEKDLNTQSSDTGFSLSKGLPLCLLAGMLSALYGFSIDTGKPIADAAEKFGAGNFKENAVYIFSNTGAFLSTLIYCVWLHAKKKTWTEYRVGNRFAGLNYMMAFVTGLLWYGQFFFYGLGHVRMGRYDFSSWAIHMIMLVLFSAIIGLLLKEWKAVSKPTIQLLILALLTLVIAVLLLTSGNRLGNQGASS